jgi:iron only hydrogenase large subunit-like protein
MCTQVMACPGGCIGGGGQPRSKDKEVLMKRQQGLYSVDERKALRRSYESPVVKALYQEWLGKPGSHEVGPEGVHARTRTSQCPLPFTEAFADSYGILV